MPQLSSETYATDLADCRRLLRGGSKTFHAASMLLPRGVREPASALYAFCRVADDAIDEAGSAEAAVVALAALRQRLLLAYAGTPLDCPCDRALAHVVARYEMPIALPEALLEGFEWDSAGRRYETLSDVIGYATRVAGTVGAMMSVLMGGRTEAVLARACDLGVAMQLSNIARDVGEDARAGRLYLPMAWMREAGIDPEGFLRDPVFSPALASVVERVLAVAEDLYRRAASGVSALPFGCRPGIEAARLMYQEIGRQVGRAGHDSVGRRAVVSTPRKLGLLGRSVANSFARRPLPSLPPLAEVRFLVEAAARPEVRKPSRAEALDARIGFVFDLFERLGERERMQRGGV